MSVRYPRTAESWYWIVEGQNPPIYDLKNRQYVDESDAGYLEFLASPFEVSRAASADELRAVLNETGGQYLDEPVPAQFVDRPVASRVSARGTALNVTLPTGVLTPFTFTDGTDPLGIHSAASGHSVLTIPETGLYAITAEVRFAQNATGDRGVVVSRNGSTGAGSLKDNRRAAANGPTETIFSSDVELVAGDAIRVGAMQNSGGNLIVHARFSLRRVE